MHDNEIRIHIYVGLSDDGRAAPLEISLLGRDIKRNSVMQTWRLFQKLLKSGKTQVFTVLFQGFRAAITCKPWLLSPLQSSAGPNVCNSWAG